MFKDWKTSLMGIIILVSFGLCVARLLAWEHLVSILSVASAAGFFVSKDSRK